MRSSRSTTIAAVALTAALTVGAAAPASAQKPERPPNLDHGQSACTYASVEPEFVKATAQEGLAGEVCETSWRFQP